MIFQHKTTELENTTRSYLLTFEDGNEEEYFVGVTTSYHTNTDFEEIINIEFLDNCGKLDKQQREEIDSWIYDNLGDWTNEGE